jgi:hypothetical protein
MNVMSMAKIASAHLKLVRFCPATPAGGVLVAPLAVPGEPSEGLSELMELPRPKLRENDH